ncbi:MAG: S8 family serine peptidase, partial [Dermatophilaceae bacterium]
MRKTRVIALRAAVCLSAIGLAGATTSTAQPVGQPAAAAQDSSSGYVVLAKEGVSAQSVADELAASGATVTSVNTAIGMVSVSSAPAGFAATARSLPGVQAAGADRVVGHAPKRDADRVLKENKYDPAASASAAPSAKKAPPAASDPLDANLWGMDLIHAPAAHRIQLGDKRVRVGILDTGVDATHPDLAANFDAQLSRNFTYDIPAIDGPCEQPSCVDPANVDDNEHGTHVAGTIAAAMNGFGVSGVAPDVGIVNIRGGQDSGFFFLGPVANALTYAGDVGIDVVNMSFYVDPWLYNCSGGAPEDSPAAAQDQDLIITVMNLALNYAHRKNVTLVSALGNEHGDLAHPRTDTASPDYPRDTAYSRTIDNATCVDLPAEGPHVIGVSALGPLGTKADYSNYTTERRSGEIELSAP